MIPETFEAWHDCITQACGIGLTRAFAQERLTALKNDRDPHTQQLVRHYGKEHVQRLIHWFEHILTTDE